MGTYALFHDAGMNSNIIVNKTKKNIWLRRRNNDKLEIAEF